MFKILIALLIVGLIISRRRRNARINERVEREVRIRMKQQQGYGRKSKQS